MCPFLFFYPISPVERFGFKNCHYFPEEIRDNDNPRRFFANPLTSAGISLLCKNLTTTQFNSQHYLRPPEIRRCDQRDDAKVLCKQIREGISEHPKIALFLFFYSRFPSYIHQLLASRESNRPLGNKRKRKKTIFSIDFIKVAPFLYASP